jgi:hypothetical protein
VSRLGQHLVTPATWTDEESTIDATSERHDLGRGTCVRVSGPSMMGGKNVDDDTTLVLMAGTVAMDDGVIPDGWPPLLGEGWDRRDATVSLLEQCR